MYLAQTFAVYLAQTFFCVFIMLCFCQHKVGVNNINNNTYLFFKHITVKSMQVSTPFFANGHF